MGSEQTHQFKRHIATTAGDIGEMTELLNVYTIVDGAPERDLAFEEKLLRADTGGGPSLFLFQWSNPVLVIGRGQSLSDITLQVCQTENIPVLRRHTGGRAVLHNRSLNMALVLPTRHSWARQIGGLYQHFTRHVSEALRQVGVATVTPDSTTVKRMTPSPICFESDFGETLLFNGRKVFGCAQRRLKETTLVHGTLLLGLDITQQSRVFNVSERRIASAMSHIPADRDPRAIMDATIFSFATGLDKHPVQRGGYHVGEQVHRFASQGTGAD